MKAVKIKKNGGPEVLDVEEISLKKPTKGEVLIEQRNRKGVWQGLWGAIERPVETEASDLCDELGLKPSSIKRLESGTTFRHTFSHFHLQIEPIYISNSLTGRTSVKSNSSTMWVLPTNLLKDQAIGISKADKLAIIELLFLRGSEDSINKICYLEPNIKKAKEGCAPIVALVKINENTLNYTLDLLHPKTQKPFNELSVGIDPDWIKVCAPRKMVFAPKFNTNL